MVKLATNKGSWPFSMVPFWRHEKRASGCSGYAYMDR